MNTLFQDEGFRLSLETRSRLSSALTGDHRNLPQTSPATSPGPVRPRSFCTFYGCWKTSLGAGTSSLYQKQSTSQPEITAQAFHSVQERVGEKGQEVTDFTPILKISLTSPGNDPQSHLPACMSKEVVSSSHSALKKIHTQKFKESLCIPAALDIKTTRN